ncbi:MAG TPA: GGDEF domain-containing protein [Polyangiaceae bacterium]|nr:GGDEF domain-containing protein [Polyangiaceae bacterium]
MSTFDEKTKVTNVGPLPKPDNPPGDDCLVVIYSKDPALLGKRFLLEASPTRVGRGPDNEIVLDGESISRRHASWERRGRRWWVVDERSTNGTYVNDELVDQEHPLSNGDRVKVGGLILKFLSGDDVESQYHEEIYRMTIFDGLMQVYNRRYLYEALEREIIRARRHGRDLSVVMFDIDHFKQVNDRYGHLAGDFVLKELARVVQSRIRRDEVFARYGGEEFSLVLPETNLDGAAALAETLRRKISEHPFTFQAETIPVTVSMGIAMLSEAERGSVELIQRADEKLYEAKRSGRNRVCL